MVEGLEGTFIELVQAHLENPYRLWETLKLHFVPKNDIMHQQLKIKFTKLRMKPNQRVDLFAAEVEELARKINETASSNTPVVGDLDKIYIFTNGLTSEYKMIVQAISVQPSIAKNWHQVKTTVKNHELNFISDFNKLQVQEERINSTYLIYNKNNSNNNKQIN